MNNKGISATLTTVIIIIIIVASIGAALILGSGSSPASQPITVYIDGKKQTGNYSEPQTIEWGTIAAGNTYTKNFTVLNNGDQFYTLKLYTTEPEGATQSWAKNLSTLNALDSVEATLVLALSDTVSSGKYTWRLLAVNGTAPTPTPTASASPTPSPTPTPNSLQFTIAADQGVKNITVTKNTEAPFVVIGDSLPKTYLFTAGDKFKFTVAIEDDYTWNGWDFSDGTTPNMNNPLIVTKTGNFTVTACIIAPEGVTD